MVAVEITGSELRWEQRGKMAMLWRQEQGLEEDVVGEDAGRKRGNAVGVEESVHDKSSGQWKL